MAAEEVLCRFADDVVSQKQIGRGAEDHGQPAQSQLFQHQAGSEQDCTGNQQSGVFLMIVVVIMVMFVVVFMVAAFAMGMAVVRMAIFADRHILFHGAGEGLQFFNQTVGILGGQLQLTGGKGDHCFRYGRMGVELSFDLGSAVGAFQILQLIGFLHGSCLLMF